MKSNLLIVSVLVIAAAAAYADVRMNAQDNNSSTRDNGTTQSETNHATGPNAIVAAWNDSHDVALNGFAGFTSFMSWGYSSNGGASFTDAGLFNPPSGWQGFGDPAVVEDTAGNAYIAALASSDGGFMIGGLYVARAASSATPTLGTPVMLSPMTSGDGFDKELMAIDRSGGANDGRVYVGISEGDFSCSSLNVKTVVAHSTSTTPLTFSSWQQVGTAGTNIMNHGIMPAVGPGGEVYVVWAHFGFSSGCAINSESVQIVKSTDGGTTFTQPNGSAGALTITTPTVTPTTMGSGTATTRTRGFPYIAVDSTPVGSPTRGNIYLVYQADPDGAGPDKSDVYFTRSTDGGQTWLPPRSISGPGAVTVNPDTTTHDNWQPSIAVSPVNGHIYVTFYDRRDDPSNLQVRVYRALSTDGGLTWNDAPLSSASFTPDSAYDPSTAGGYFGDYNWATADANGLQFSWGDSRTTCAPPIGAANPCSPSGRPDQDAFFASVSNLSGPDLFIQPWGDVTGIGPLWETPDIYVVDGSNMQVNALKGIVNNLRAHVRNLGNAAANGVVIRFKYAPAGAGIADADFEEIGTATVNFGAAGAANSDQVIPISWDLSDLNHTHAGWPGPISAYDHFCVRVWVEYAPDINMSNNYAQNNFFDVQTQQGGMWPVAMNLMLGNEFQRAALGHIVVSKLPEGFHLNLGVRGVKTELNTFPREYKFSPQIIRLRETLTRPAVAVSEEERRVVVAPVAESVESGFVLAPREIRPAVVVFDRPRAYQGKTDVVADVSLVVNGRPVSGVSLRLYKAPGPPEDLNGLRERTAPIVMPVASREPVRERPILTAQLQRPTEIMEVPARIPERVKFRRTYKADFARVFEGFSASMEAMKARATLSDPKRGRLNIAASDLSPDELRSLVTPEDAQRIGEAKGKYLLSIWVYPAGRGLTEVGADAYIQTDSVLDSPVGQRLRSNGTLENRYLDAIGRMLGQQR